MAYGSVNVPGRLMADNILMPDGTTSVSAALSQKAALSVQETIEKTGISGQSVAVPAADLPAYIAALPRLRTEHLEINVTKGTISNKLMFSGFYGSGTITINGSKSTVANGIDVDNCQNYIRILNLDIRNAKKNYGVSANGLCNLGLEDVSIDGQNISGDTKFGVSALGFNCRVSITGSSLINLTHAIYTNQATVSGHNLVASGNTTGAIVEAGGIVTLSGSTPDLVGADSNAHWGGGMIVKSDGTLI